MKLKKLSFIISFVLCLSIISGFVDERTGSEDALLPWQDVYGPSMMGCVHDPDTYPELTEEIITEREDFLRKRVKS